MIYVSTSCVRHEKIKDCVAELACEGFKNIELSGGTKLYDEFEEDLVDLKHKYGLNYLCHNYFPPPRKPFVLNLASLDDATFEASLNHLSNVIDLSERLGASKFAFHAGFLIDIRVNEIGKRLTRDKLYEKDEAELRFCSAFEFLKKRAGNVTLYIENNVFSGPNAITYNDTNPFMLTDFTSYTSLKSKIDFELLLDVAHLKVSSKSLGLDWEEEFHNMMGKSYYVHVSDNDGITDSNNELLRDSELFHLLKESPTENRDFTLEVYDGISALKNSYDVLSDAVS